MDTELRDKVTRLEEQLGQVLRFQKWLLTALVALAAVGLSAVATAGQYKERVDAMQVQQGMLLKQVDDLDMRMARLQLDVVTRLHSPSIDLR